MARIRLIGALTIAVVGCGTSSDALAANAFGFYLGAGAGESHLRAGTEVIDPGPPEPYIGPAYTFDAHHSAWKVTTGIRPLSALGVELQYMDFGKASTGVVPTGGGTLLSAEAEAVTMFGLGYLPLPLPFLDVYGKLGVARLRTSLKEIGPIAIICPIGAALMPCQPPTFNQVDWTTNLAYGAGVQGRIRNFAIRAEYERISGGERTPDMVSLGVTWTF